jgi:hypothetical protein
MQKRQIKFRFFCPPAKAFVESYNYKGAVDELFNEDPHLIASQYTGEEDSNGNEIWEGDKIKFKKINHPQEFEAVIEYEQGAFLAKITNPVSTLSPVYLHELPVYGEDIIVTGNIFDDSKSY